MARKKKRNYQDNMRCPYCGRAVQLHPASYIYGDDTIKPDSYLYVCNGYPNHCDAYVGADQNRRPKGTLANSELRHKRIEAHRALDQIWKNRYMTKHETYAWLQTRLGLSGKEMHIGNFSDYYCGKVIQECQTYVKEQKKKGGGKAA